jgi:hypothetical protein
MAEKPTNTELPRCAAEYIDLVVRKMGYRRKVRAEVREELAGHFEDALRGITDEQERVERAMAIIKGFGEAKVLATLIRRGKKRCRPMWVKVLIGCFQAVSIAIFALVGYIVLLLTGKPYISIDYVAQLNKMVRPVADESLNATPYYDRAGALLSPEPNDLPNPWRDQATASQLAAGREWVAGNAAAIEEVCKGNEKPYAWETYSTSDGSMMAVKMPNLVSRKSLSSLLSWKAWLDAQDGNCGGAFENVRQCYLLGQHMEAKGTLIEQLVAAALEARAVNAARGIIAIPDVGSDLLAKFQADYEELLARSDFRMHFEGESMCFEDAVQRTFTKSGRLCPLALGGTLRTIMSTSGSGSEEWVWDEIIGSSYMLLTHPDKEKTLEQAKGFYDRAQQLASKNPFQVRTIHPTMVEYTEQLMKGNVMLRVLLPAVDRIVLLSWRTNADCHALITQIAAERYKREKGAYPDSLEELQQAGYLKEIPMDPWSDKPLVYRKTAEGYTLYSVGTNFVDDGGKSVNSKGKTLASPNLDGLDMVFWPRESSVGSR